MKITCFDFKSPDYKKLESYGFIRNGQNYGYITQILNGQFELRVDIDGENGKVKTELFDAGSGEPYTLHLVDGAGGAFVGEVREAFGYVLNNISEKCFKNDVFKGDCARAVIEYVRNKYGDELEFLWSGFPSNAVWRRKDNNKWYGVMLTVAKSKLGLNSDEVVNIIDLRINLEHLDKLADGVRYCRGYHMNKKHWFTMCLDGSVPVEEIYGYIDASYLLAKK